DQCSRSTFKADRPECCAEKPSETQRWLCGGRPSLGAFPYSAGQVEVDVTRLPNEADVDAPGPRTAPARRDRSRRRALCALISSSRVGPSLVPNSFIFADRCSRGFCPLRLFPELARHLNRRSPPWRPRASAALSSLLARSWSRKASRVLRIGLAR